METEEAMRRQATTPSREPEAHSWRKSERLVEVGVVRSARDERAVQASGALCFSLSGCSRFGKGSGCSLLIDAP